MITDFESKAQRTAAGYAPQDAEDLAEWVKERVLIPAEELSTLLADASWDVPDDVTRIARGSEAWLVHDEDAAHIERTLLGRTGHAGRSRGSQGRLAAVHGVHPVLRSTHP